MGRPSEGDCRAADGGRDAGGDAGGGSDVGHPPRAAHPAHDAGAAGERSRWRPRQPSSSGRWPGWTSAGTRTGPLFGRTVVVTRAREQASTRGRLRELGRTPSSCPSSKSEIRPMGAPNCAGRSPGGRVPVAGLHVGQRRRRHRRPLGERIARHDGRPAGPTGEGRRPSPDRMAAIWTPPSARCVPPQFVRQAKKRSTALADVKASHWYSPTRATARRSSAPHRPDLRFR